MSISLWSLHWEIAHPLVWLACGALFLSLSATLWAVSARLYSHNKWRWGAAVLLNLIAYSGVLMLLAPPDRLASADRKAVLLTEGADPASATSFDDVFVAPGAAIQTTSPASFLLDTGQLILQRPALKHLYTRGHGLAAEQWRELPSGVTVHFDAADLTGPVEMDWPRQLTIGEPLAVTGRYLGPNERPVSIRLLDPAGAVADESTVRDGQDFRLAARPRTTGNLEYRLQVDDGDQEPDEQTVAVSVSPGRTARLLIIQSAPSFESRHLKNWASSQGNQLLILTRISRDRHISQAVNLPSNAETSLSPALLARQDLAIIDGRSWAELPPGQRDWFIAAVEDGLGLLILADSDLAAILPIEGDKLLRGYALQPAQRQDEMMVPRWPGASAELALPVLPYDIETTFGAALVTGTSGQPLSAVVRVGRGKVALSILRERFRWLTNGEQTAYSAYWALLIERIGRGRTKPYLLPETGRTFNAVSQQMLICAAGDGQSLEAEVQGPGSEFNLILAADRLGSDRGCAPFWPALPGWYRIRLLAADGGEPIDSQYRFVFSPGQWLSHHRHQRQAATLQRVAANPPDPGLSDDTPIRTPVRPFWPWLLLVVAASLLWLERKLPA